MDFIKHSSYNIVRFPQKEIFLLYFKNFLKSWEKHAFSHNQPGEKEEIIVLTKNEIKVGGIYRMGSYDIHVVMEKRYEGQHIMSNFLKTGVLNEIWPENKSVELCDVYTREEYERKKYLAGLCHMSIKNKAEIERRLDYFDRQRDIHRDHI